MLLGTFLLGSQFIQDPKPDWIKINGIVLGESKKFSYKVSWSRDIGTLLDTLSKDPAITSVLYNWKTGDAYTKIGFDLTDRNDYARNPDYTTFILKHKISQFVPQPQPQPQPQPSQPVSTNFVTWDGNNFMCNNDKFVPVGPNIYWLGYTENHNYPARNQVIEMFDVSSRLKSTVIRSHTLGISSGKPNTLRPSNNTLNEKAWDAIDFAFFNARKYNIKLICPLTDAYTWANGNYGDFCNTRGIPKKDFWTNIDVRNDFKDYINKWLNHRNKYTGIKIKNDPALAFIELGNELGNIRPEHGSVNVPTKEWLEDISSYIKSIDKNHLILGPCDECLGSKESDDFNVKNIDIYSGHFYSQDFNRVDFGANNAKRVNKPYIIGEYSPHFDDNWFTELEKRENVRGSVFWNLYPHENGLAGGNRIDHQDGQTVWYPENKDKLLRISNHFRRMRGLPIIHNI